MDDTLSKFADEYGGRGLEISKFKEYRERSILSFFIGGLLIGLAYLQEVRGALPDFPNKEYVVYLPGLILLCIWLLILHGKRRLETSTEDVVLYEIGAAIDAVSENNTDKALSHLEELDSEVSRSGNSLFSQSIEQNIADYCDRLENSEDAGQLLEDTFEDFMLELVSELNKENNLDSILDRISEDTGNKFEGSVLIDTIQQININVWIVSAIGVVILSLITFLFVGKDGGYYFAIASLTVLQFLSNQQEN
ncbi:hypothetical protein [Halomicrobium sp. LC1Hm]|uniref:hypothetical protein n=1 Tax=Halomicrobium sp. LC1Hm TaxID=2610902 RepID=UPI0012983937|nr:hypothetical protein [Halomicrobium sp. LC1Hm]QGA82769.1 hypothetical protein LC1Hm_1725 [Halomicrobium sp. LC1Hm]